MYCPSCGNALPQGLSYCNRCGADLSGIQGSGSGKGMELTQAGKLPSLLVVATVFVTLVLSGLMLGAMPLMNLIGLNQGAILSFVGLIFLTMVAIDGVLLWQLFRITGRAKQSPVAAPERIITSGLEPNRGQPLLEPRMSVTDHTTRNFEPAYEERRNKE